MYCVTAEKIGTAHQKAVRQVIEYGETVVTEDAKSTLELDAPLCITVTRPYDQPYRHPAYQFSQQMLDEYVPQITESDTKGFVYTYGNRLHVYPGLIDPIGYCCAFNQINFISEQLKQQSTTRRAIAHTWIVLKDNVSDEPPCLQSVQFTIRNNKLNCVAYFRSNDIAIAYGANAYGLYKLMEKIQSKINDENLYIGTLTTISNCAHIYDSDLQAARKIAYTW